MFYTYTRYSGSLEIYGFKYTPNVRCVILNFQENELHSESYYQLDFSNFQEDCFFEEAKPLADWFLVKYEDEFDKLINLKEGNNRIFVKLDGRNIPEYVVIKSIYASHSSRSHSEEITFYESVKPKLHYSLLYPAVIPYDIIAGTLNIIGFPFLFGALMIGGKNPDTEPFYKRIPTSIFWSIGKILTSLESYDKE
jgi:hypothetical protein